MSEQKDIQIQAKNIVQWDKRREWGRIEMDFLEGKVKEIIISLKKRKERNWSAKIRRVAEDNSCKKRVSERGREIGYAVVNAAGIKQLCAAQTVLLKSELTPYYYYYYY